MSEYEFTISLRVRHPSIDPAAVTQTLGIEPQHTWKAGAPRCGPTGEALEGVYRESYWLGRLMEEPQLSSARVSVESVLRQILAQLRRGWSCPPDRSHYSAVSDWRSRSRFTRNRRTLFPSHNRSDTKATASELSPNEREDFSAAPHYRTHQDSC
jgi:hypothetical protein